MQINSEILSYLNKISQKDFRLDLGPMREACHLLGNPQEAYASVHIVGTNGKGSTAAFLSSLLQATGYKVGLMTSPHLIDVRERIQINREWISWEAFSELVREIQSLLPQEDFLSYFEMVTLVGFEYFSKMGVEIAVVEAGMGGRFDATNVIKAQVGIITPISLDHEVYLGDSITKIAREKLGILKPEMTVIHAPQTEEALIVIEESCQSLGLELLEADPSNIDFPLGLKGNHQRINAACALLAAKTLVSEELLDRISANALLKTKWPGRLDTIHENPTILVDGAHNFSGIQTLADYLKGAHPNQTIHFLVGALQDKNWETMFRPLAEIANRFICVTPQTERALSASTLASCLNSFGKPVEVFEEGLEKGLAQILPQIGARDLLVATGSLYVVGEILKCFHKQDTEGFEKPHS